MREVKKNLVIVAHPDDETIWMGGTILKNKNCEWTIVSLCRKNDEERMPKFMNVCKYYDANSIISDLDDERLTPLTTEEVAKKIESILPDDKYHNIYTHGDNGEYGHIRHKEIHKAVKKLIEEKKLKCKKLLSFSYKLGEKTVPNIPNLKIPIPDEKADESIKLSEDNFIKKVKLVRDMYGFGNNSFEVLSCNRVETFKEN